MRTVLIAAATLLISAPAWAAPGLWQWGQMDLSAMQPMTSQQLSGHIDDWVYAADGSIVGSLASLNGDMAVVHVSAFFKPSGQVTVPTADLGVVGGKLVVHGASFADMPK